MSNNAGSSKDSRKKKGQSQANQGNSGGGRRKKSRKKPRMDPVKYWGDAGALPVRHDYVLESQDPTAVIRSLGKAPIPGKNSAPELYFEVLYTRAAALAQALSFAGGLNQPAQESSESDDGEPASSDAEAAVDTG